MAASNVRNAIINNNLGLQDHQMTNSNQYWKGLEEIETTLDSTTNQGEFGDEGLPLDEVFSDSEGLNSNRRDFLKYFGFSVSAVALAACNKAPVKYAVPYVEKPENVTPGVPLYYATNCGIHNEGYPILAKVREGRPIKLDGNDNSPLAKGGLSAAGQASILSLYDVHRLPNPVVNGEEQEDWAEVDKAVKAALNGAGSKGIRIVTRTVSSPLLQNAINQFKEAYPNTEHVVYDPISYSGILKANEQSWGKKVIPNYHFDKAEVVVSFGADFMGTWLSPTRFAADFAETRRPTEENPTMSRHYQIEGLMSMTGTNADYRYPMSENKHGLLIANLFRKLAGVSQIDVPEMNLPGNALDKIAADLKAAKGKSLVISNSNDPNVQIMVNVINLFLTNYGRTVNVNENLNISSYDEAAFNNFVLDAAKGNVGAAIMIGVNPVYHHAKGNAFAEALKNVKTVISTSMTMDETTENAAIVAPDDHWLEKWDVKQPVNGQFTFSQPVISKVFNTRSVIHSLHTWAGNDIQGDQPVMDLAKSYVNDLGGNWKQCIHDGYFSTEHDFSMGGMEWLAMESDAASAIANAYKQSDVELVLYQKVGVLDGTWSLNPWCHELPDPVTKVAYDNYVTIAKRDADEVFNLENGDFVKVTTANGTIDRLPVLVQPGQARGTIGIALGFGRKVNEQESNDLVDLGKNAYPLTSTEGGSTSYLVTSGVSLEKVGSGYTFAQTQTHWTIEGRDTIREATLGEYEENPRVRNEHAPHIVSLWDEFDYSKGHHWGMAIDLNACNGCGACVVSCSIENNVPIVGRDEIRRRREMHWIRIDRYYSFNSGGESLTKEKAIEGKVDEGQYDHYEDVSTMHVPMMCQHCDHAPCETVCPVLATTHSSEGLNQMTYNRCIGTKYCGNNCPYKVRRFNWFRYNLNSKYNYHFNNELGRMVLNPDVTVRSRGVMEKCSFCVQNIQMAKLKAKRENRKVQDGDVTTACQRSCPTNAIVFGDRNDPNSRIAKLFSNNRSYKMLEETNVQPSVVYMTKIRNKETEQETTTSHS